MLSEVQCVYSAVSHLNCCVFFLVFLDGCSLQTGLYSVEIITAGLTSPLCPSHTWQLCNRQKQLNSKTFKKDQNFLSFSFSPLWCVARTDCFLVPMISDKVMKQLLLQWLTTSPCCDVTLNKVTLLAGCYGNSSAWHPGNRFSGHDSAEHGVTEREKGGGKTWCRRKSC